MEDVTPIPALPTEEQLMRLLRQGNWCWLEEQAMLKAVVREMGNSLAAQFGQAKPNKCRSAKPRPHWMRIRSFCVHSPYG